MDTAQRESILVVGRGSFVTALLNILQHYGASRIHVVLLDASAKDVHQLAPFIEPWAAAAVPSPARSRLKEGMRPSPFLLNVENLPAAQLAECLHKRRACRSVFYVSHTVPPGAEMAAVEVSCRTNRQSLYPALLFAERGMAGPVMHADHESEPGWTTAWRTIHETELRPSAGAAIPPDSFTAEKILAGLLASEWQAFLNKQNDDHSRYYWLNLTTMEGLWYSTKQVAQTEVADWISSRLTPCPIEHNGKKQHVAYKEAFSLLEEGCNPPPLAVPAWLEQLSERTCEVQGLFHVWGEGGLTQLPLHQCRIQPVDPLSTGPALLLDEQVFSGFTALDARKNAALGGLEAFAGRLLQLEGNDKAIDKVLDKAVGCGTSKEESQYKAIMELLLKQLLKHDQNPLSSSRLQPVSGIVFSKQDYELEYCQHILSLYNIRFQLFAGEDEYGFPAAAVQIADRQIVKVGLTPASVWKDACLQALHTVQQDHGQEHGCHDNHYGHNDGHNNDRHAVDRPIYIRDTSNFHPLQPVNSPLPYLLEQVKLPTIQEIAARFQKKQKRLSLYLFNASPYFSHDDGIFFSLAALEKGDAFQ
ncbi:hypothetical protein [Paenibacillus senegalensis]|uniref:hypothetical protein n=1 Tax=Paenibacillus senegalensis TaxID=1465766 RepID=UPI000474550E|nr:hypothetical protein [Paenibacillus senegalensis]